MSKPVLSYLDYLKEAFNAAPLIPGMGRIPINKLALSGAFILGFANPGFWFAGLALETLYLYLLSTNPRFQKVVQAKYIGAVEQEKAEKINSMIMSLDKESTDRLAKLNLNLSEVNRLMEIDSGSFEFIKESKQKTLAQLPVLFLKLLFTRNLVIQSIEKTDVDELKRHADKLRMQLNNPEMTDILKKSVKSNLEIVEKRLENFRKAKENLQLIEMELNRIENQVQLVREEMALNRSPESLSASIDRINSTLGETEAWMNTHSEFFTRIGNDDVSVSIPRSIQTPEIN